MFSQIDLIEAERFIEVYQKLVLKDCTPDEGLKLHKASLWLHGVISKIRQDVMKPKEQSPSIVKPSEPKE